MPESSITAEDMMLWLVHKNIAALHSEYFYVESHLLKYIIDHIKADVEKVPELKEMLAQTISYDEEVFRK